MLFRRSRLSAAAHSLLSIFIEFLFFGKSHVNFSLSLLICKSLVCTCSFSGGASVGSFSAHPFEPGMRSELSVRIEKKGAWAGFHHVGPWDGSTPGIRGLPTTVLRVSPVQVHQSVELDCFHTHHFLHTTPNGSQFFLTLFPFSFFA